jgi:hypothetical protein
LSAEHIEGKKNIFFSTLHKINTLHQFLADGLHYVIEGSSYSAQYTLVLASSY